MRSSQRVFAATNDQKWQQLALIRAAVNGLDNRLRLRHCCRIQRRASPRNIHRQTREIDNTSVAAIATQVVRRAHEDTVDWTWLDTQSTEHALRVVDRVASYLKALAVFDTLLANVDTIDRTGLCALITGNTRR